MVVLDYGGKSGWIRNGFNGLWDVRMPFLEVYERIQIPRVIENRSPLVK